MTFNEKPLGKTEKCPNFVSYIACDRYSKGYKQGKKDGKIEFAEEVLKEYISEKPHRKDITEPYYKYVRRHFGEDDKFQKYIEQRIKELRK
jgi:hypothetical protein